MKYNFKALPNFQLQDELKKVRLNQQDQPSRSNSRIEHAQKQVQRMRGMKLYDIPQAIRIHVFANGESSQRTEVVYAQTLTEVREVGFCRLYYDHTGIFDRNTSLC